MIFHRVLLIGACLIGLGAVPTAALACSKPSAQPNADGYYEVSARRSSISETCISLYDFVDQTLEIQIIRGRPRSMILGSLYLSTYQDPIIATPRWGGWDLRMKGDNYANTRIRFRVAVDEPAQERVEARWMFTGGHGFAPPEAKLMANGAPILVLGCRDTNFGQARLASEYQPPIMLGSGQRQRFADVKLNAQIVDGVRTGLVTDLRFSRLTPTVRSFAAEDSLLIGETLVANTGFSAAYDRLRATCHAQVVYGPQASMSCRIATEMEQTICLDRGLANLQRQLSMTYAALTPFATASEMQAHWQTYAAMIERRLTCLREAACLRDQMAPVLATFEASLTPAIRTLLREAEGAERSTALSPIDANLASTLADLGIASEFINEAALLHQANGRSFVLAGGPRQSGGFVVYVIHDPVEPIGEMEIDPADPAYIRLVGRVVAPIITARNVIAERGPRRVAGGKVELHHYVAGVVATDFHTGAPSPVTFGRYQVDGSIWQDDVISAATRPTFMSDRVSVQTVLDQMAADDQRRTEIAEARAAREAARLAREQAAASAAAEGGYIYKNAAFWSRFDDADRMRKIFDGTSSADSRTIAGWTIAYYEQCARFLPSNIVRFTTRTTTETRNGLNALLGTRTTVTQFDVDARFAPAVEQVRQSPADAYAVMDALGIGSGSYYVDFSRVADLARQMLQPLADANRMIASSGCQGAVTEQFRTNLLASVGAASRVQSVPILPASAARAASDQPI